MEMKRQAVRSEECKEIKKKEVKEENSKKKT